METITGAEALMRALADEGVRTIFGYPGGAIMPVYDALYDYTRGQNKRFDHVLVRHEQAAAHAAEGYARISGRTGVCLVTSGPGVTNTLTGVADAMMDSTPIVVIAGQVGLGALGTDAFQEVDLVGVSQPISKWSYQIRRFEDIAWAVSRAFYIARSGRPGPVVLDFPKNVQQRQGEWKPARVKSVRSYIPYPTPNKEAVAAAADIINAAERPFALVGQGVELGGAQKELLAFLEKAGIPAARTMLGLSAMPTEHPLCMGMAGMHGNYAPSKKTQECDVLIAIGMRFSDRVTGLLTTYAKQAKVIHLDIDRSEIGKNVKPTVPVLGDCKQTLPMLTKLVRPAEHTAWVESFKAYDKEERDRVIEPAIHPRQGQLLMGEVVNAVREAVQDDAVLVTDVGQNQMFACRYFGFRRPRSLATSGGLGTMGYGLPAAVGACFAEREGQGRPVCLFSGDGGLQMSIQEFGTIMEQRVPVKMVLLNNNYLGNVRQWQDMFFGGRKSFTHMLNPRYEDICRAYHIDYLLARTHGELQAAVQKMLATPRACLLECDVKEEDNVLPMTPPGKSVDEMLLEIKS